MGSKNLWLVQLLRGVASLLVVFLHTTFCVNKSFGIPFFGDFFTFGGAGVDIFFVLSGFIITYTNKKVLDTKGGVYVFFKRRFVRIFPIYWIVITGFLLLQFILPGFYRTHYPIHTGTLLSTYLLLPHHIMVNGVSWTLTYELFFYLLFSLAFIIKNKYVLFTAGILYTAVLILLPLLHIDTEKMNSWLSVCFFPMNIEFFIGIIIALIIPRLNQKLSVPFIVIGITAFLGAAIFSNGGYQIISNSLNRVILYGVPCFFIIAGVVRYELKRPVKMHSILISLGEASYSLYLIHLIILTAAIQLLAGMHLANPVLIHIVVVLMILIVCGISMLLFKWIERPLIAKLNRLL